MVRSSKHGSVQVTGQNPFRNAPKSSKNRSEIVQNRSRIEPKTLKLAPWGLRISGVRPELLKSPIFVNFRTISGRFSDPKIVPKSIKIASGRRLNFDAFPDLRFHRFFVRFGLQNELRNRRFFDSGSQSPTLQKPCFSLGFNRFSEVRSSRNL